MNANSTTREISTHSETLQMNAIWTNKITGKTKSLIKAFLFQNGRFLITNSSTERNTCRLKYPQDTAVSKKHSIETEIFAVQDNERNINFA